MIMNLIKVKMINELMTQNTFICIVYILCILKRVMLKMLITIAPFKLLSPYTPL